jgi:DNA-binding FadR family transcriptional regulator
MTAVERLAATLRRRILVGELAPGDRLPAESDMSPCYLVSRTTAREAIRVLEAQGLVKIRRGASGGVFIAQPGSDQLVESLHAGIQRLTATESVSISALVQFRELLEISSLELAALRRTDTELRAIRACVPESPATCARTSKGFHSRIVEATHNPLLEVFAEPVYRILHNRFISNPLPAVVRRDVEAHHREIMSFIEVRDQAGAREAGRAHLRYLVGMYR